MATITIPNQTMLTNVQVRRGYSNHAQGSPYTFAQQVYAWQGKIWSVTFDLKPLRDTESTEAEAWVTFLLALEGQQNTFNMDLSGYVPGSTGLTSVPMRLAQPLVGWSIDLLYHFGISIEAVEAIST